MGSVKHEFARILERILEEETAPRTTQNVEFPYENQIHFDLGLVDVSPPIPPRVHRVYPQRPRKSRFATPPPKREFTLKTQDLTGDERAAAALLFESANLALPEELSESAVKKAFRCLAKAYHPDSRIGLDKAERPELSLLFAQSNRAYRLLTKALRGRGQAA